MIRVELQFETSAGGPPAGGVRDFAEVPRIGESIVTGNGPFVVVDVQWLPNGQPKVVAQPKG